MGTPRLELTGQKFGRLTVVRLAHVKRATYWLCRCECGEEKTVEGTKLRTGRTASCGCYMRECQRALVSPIKHGHTSLMGGPTRTYQTWDAMIQRCGNPRNGNYRRYGARGITVCDRWMTFANFLADMGEKPVGMTIDRRDVNRGYEPGNCRWATAHEQAQNTSRTKLDPVAVEQIRYLWNEHQFSCASIARAFEVTPTTIRNAALGRSWPNLVTHDAAREGVFMHVQEQSE